MSAEVTRWKLKKKALGGYVVAYDCPNCGADLSSPVTDAGEADTCPECRVMFEVPQAAGDEYERLRKQQAAAKAAKQAEQKQQREEELRQKQRIAQKRQKELEESSRRVQQARRAQEMQSSPPPPARTTQARRDEAATHREQPTGGGSLSISVGRGIICVLGMAIMLYFAFVFDTTVDSGGFVGAVNNIGLLSDREVGVIVGAALFIVGAIPTRFVPDE